MFPARFRVKFPETSPYRVILRVRFLFPEIRRVIRRRVIHRPGRLLYPVIHAVKARAWVLRRTHSRRPVL
jgi:hypothetical protein